MFGKISDEEKELAVQFLMDNIPKDCLKKVWIEVQNKEYFWSLSLNPYFGTYVRNTLREGGFDWGPLALDALWNTLIEEAARGNPI
ncbi:MAG TPA: hypothetical protein VIO58_09200 [Candidatus Methanoperedens sp.]